MEKRLVKISKLLSLVLRHQPEKIGIVLDEEGWIGVEDLLRALERHGKGVARETLDAVVEQNDKKRFVIRHGRIRANQGHSIDVQLRLEPSEPPEHLYHGTAGRFLASIRAEGLRKMRRQHVHLSQDRATAHRVGVRHGRPVILRVRSGAMHKDDFAFFRSENGVWLTDSVPSSYLEESEDET